MLPRTAATALLYFGTAVFPASLFLPEVLTRAQLASLGASEETITLLMGGAYTASIALPVASWLASFAAAVLAFIGGLQQAAAVQSGSASATPLVVLGIGAALVGWAAVASALSAVLLADAHTEPLAAAWMNSRANEVLVGEAEAEER